MHFYVDFSVGIGSAFFAGGGFIVQTAVHNSELLKNTEVEIWKTA